MNDPTPTPRHDAPESPATPASVLRDPLTLLALASGLLMGHVVAALASLAADSERAMPAAIVFLVFGSGAVVCALASVPRPRWVAPRIGRWIAAIGVGVLGALLPPLLF